MNNKEDMPCVHLKGVINNGLVSGDVWDEREDYQLKSIEFWFKNMDGAIRYDIAQPQPPFQFTYCPLCGEKL